MQLKRCNSRVGEKEGRGELGGAGRPSGRGSGKVLPRLQRQPGVTSSSVWYCVNVLLLLVHSLCFQAWYNLYVVGVV